MTKSKTYREYFEELLDEIHQLGYNLTGDSQKDGKRIVTFEKYQIVMSIAQTESGIDFDIYAPLASGIYELGDLHLISRKMLELKKLALKYNGREMNTTERLYPEDRQGSKTSTSGL